MIFIPEILFICLIIFLYCLFIFGKDDFLLLRKNISLEQLFSIAIGTFLVALFGARLSFVVTTFNLHYLQPLVFFLFPYFPGLSLSGGIIGGVSYLWYICQRSKVPFPRVFDIYVISFLYTFSAGALLVVLGELFKTVHLLLPLTGESIVDIIFAGIITHIFLTNDFNDGSIGYLGISLFSFFHVLAHLWTALGKWATLVTFENGFLCCLSLFCLFMYIQTSRELQKGKR